MELDDDTMVAIAVEKSMTELRIDKETRQKAVRGYTSGGALPPAAF